MQSNKNKVIVASAGSGKTTYIVEEALRIKNKKLLILTYTNENLDQISTYFIENNGCVPPNILIQSWYSFLLQEGIRPYQNHMFDRERTRSIYFSEKISRYHKKDNYFTSSNDVYSHKASEFFVECNRKSKGLVVKRLAKVYDCIFIDELQDLAGYDLQLLEILFQSSIHIIAVGDPRQATFSTNNAQKNRQYRKSEIYKWLKEKDMKKEIILEEKNDCHRCNQQICDFADALFPDFPKTASKNNLITGHDGIFHISTNDAQVYIKQYNPVLLRYSKVAGTLGFPAINIGLAKGRTYGRVLIFPTKPMLAYLKTKDPEKAGDKSKLYVAVTRAKYSVGFVIN